ncbi:prolyl oligopeptidase family serine peptidase [Chitinophaga oryziterrae]|uniref:Acyl-peptide hydrolase n=1 Tax=Chitinophaga oryziterrae TaxID=1031224 RepID=A0A6N8JCH8_9BACT|nr:prolyl oligopeptidase family serine peptidase [Chitinophaga oryziterrae]MVT41812.1 prolyl oligopeptidase family serine peptidase [Chitinophaga oryziterrae]
MKKTIAVLATLITFHIAYGQVTIENLLSVPFPTELKSSPDGKHIAWVFNDKGARNVFIADAPDFIPRKVTNHRKDDGLDITSLAFTPDGNRLLFTEGNTTNGAGEAANPALLQEKTGQFIWVVNVDGSGLRKIVSGDNSAPGNDIVVFISKGKVWRASLTDTAKAPAQLFEARGNISDLRWSPDGKNLAFISNRGDHAFLGIFDIKDSTVAYPDPSVDIDMQPVWSPDSKWLAYIRVPNRKDVLPFTELRKGSPWSIRLLEAGKEQAKTLWKAAEGRGSVLYTHIPDTYNLLLWTADNQLVFPWEKDGWQHLYALDIFSVAAPRLLTPGEGEVENMLLSADGKSVVYNTNINDSHRRHIWQVAVAGGNPVQLSKGTGIEWSPVNTQAGIVAIQSTAITPGWPIKLDGMEKIAPALFPSSFPAASLVTPTVISFPAKDGMLIHGQLFLPPGYQKDTKYPALVFIHGGSRRQMILGFHYMAYYNNDYAMNQYYASKGYIVLAVNYRSGIGYGMEFREALHYGANGASEYNDIIGAGLYLRGRTDVNTKRIGLWGGSYGGFLTAMGLSRNSDIFACGVDIHGVHNWNDEMKNWLSDYDPATRTAFAATALASSPVSFVKGWKSPVLFIHGDDDRNVPFSETVHMAEKLREQKVYWEELIIPDEIHDFLLYKSWVKGYYRAADFFDRMMK